MIIKKRITIILVTIVVAIIFVVPPAGSATKKTLDAGSTWEVVETTSLKNLTIKEGAVIKAPEGYSITMTIDGIETPIEPGIYTGNIMLTPTKHTGIYYKARSGIEDTYNFRTGIYVNNGEYMPEKSVEAAVVGGEVTDTAAKDIRITSVGDKFNGIIIEGNSKYSIVNPVINLTGWGGYDFAGYGAAIRTDGKAEVTIENARINNNGCERLAVWVGGDSITHVNNSEIEVHNGPLPEVSTSGLMPLYGGTWRMGFTGNVRATLVVGNGTAYYNNTHVRAEAWGALSTDDVQDVRLYAVNCHVETVESGYGSYVDQSSRNTFSGCRFDVADYGLILGGGEPNGIVTDGTVVNSRRMGVMIHNNSTGKLTIDKGSVFNTKGTVIQVRTAHPTIIVDNAELNAENGIILQAIMDDDPSVYGGGPGGMPDGAGGPMPGGGPGGGMPGGAGGPMPGGPGGGMPGGPGGIAGDKSDITAAFKNVNLNGDIINSMTSLGEMIVSFENTAITGAITTATSVSQAVIDGVEVSIETYYYMGEVKNTFCATDDDYGLQVSLDGNSTWIVDETSYLTGLTIAGGSSIKAPDGYKVTMTVDGMKKPIAAGAYEGRIVLKVTSGA